MAIATTFADHAVAPRYASNKPGLLTRLVRSLQASRQRQAERIIADYIETHGSRFSDSMERQIEERFCR